MKYQLLVIEFMLFSLVSANSNVSMITKGALLFLLILSLYRTYTNKTDQP